MNVLFVAREYPPFEVGGVARHTFCLVKHLRRLGVSCKVLSFGDPRIIQEGVVFIKPSSSVISRSNRPLANDSKVLVDILRLTTAAKKLVANEKFDVVHVEEPYVGAFVTFKRKITTIHDTSYGELKPILRGSLSSPSLKRALFYVLMGFGFEQACVASSRVIITPYEHVKEELLRIYRTPKEKIKVIVNGVDALDIPETCNSENKVAAKRKLGLPMTDHLIFTTAQHIARKRLDTLVEAVKLLRGKEVKEFHVVIGGDGPLRLSVMGLVRKYGLEKDILLPGWVSREQLELYYQAADIFALPSEYEAGPLTLLEAMAYGVPVVSSRIDGFASLIRDGIDGLLFPVGDPHALSDCVKKLLLDDPLRSQISSSAKLFAQRFDWKTVAEETLRVYESMQ